MNEYYKDKFERGLEYQDFIADVLRRDYGTYIGTYSSKAYQNEHGESAAGYEIKFDMMYAKTGNIYIEVAEKSHAGIEQFTASGVMRDDNTWAYLIGDYNEAFLFSKRQLREICTGPESYRQRKNIRRVEKPTSIGYLFPREFFINSAILLRHFVFKKAG